MGKKAGTPLPHIDFLEVAQTQMQPLARKRKTTLASTDVGPSKKSTVPKKTPPGPPTSPRVEQPSVAAIDRGKKVVDQASSAIGTLPRGLVWTAGLVSEFENGLLPPRHYYEPSELSPDEVKHLANLETATLQTASMIHAYVALNQKFSKLQTENANLKKEVSASNAKAEEEKKKAEEEKKKAEEEKKKAETALRTAEEAQKLVDEALQRAEEASKKAEDAKTSEQKALSKLEDEKKHRQEAENESDAMAAEAQSRIDQLKAALDASIDGSFRNAIQWIQYFQPDLLINE